MGQIFHDFYNGLARSVTNSLEITWFGTLRVVTKVKKDCFYKGLAPEGLQTICKTNVFVNSLTEVYLLRVLIWVQRGGDTEAHRKREVANRASVSEFALAFFLPISRYF